MSFNLGAFAGAAATSGMNTYQMLESIESQKKKDELVQNQLDEAKALKAASAETYGQVGAPETALPGRKLSEGDVANAYAIDQGDPAAVAPKMYTREQANEDYAKRLYAINPERAMQTEMTGSQLKRIKAEDEFSKWHQDSLAQIQKDPVGWVRDHQDEYNKAKSGHLNDGYTGKVVESADKQSFSFVRTDAKGKLVDSTPIDKNTAEAALKSVAFSRFSAMPGKFKDSAELGLKQEEVGLKGREVGLKEKLLPSEIAKNMGAANQANMHASVYSNMLQTAKDSKEAGKAMQPFLDEFAQMTPEDQNGPKGQAVLLKGATAGAQKSKDLAGIVSMLRKPDRGAVSAEQEKAAYVAYNEATTPEQIKAVKAKYPDVFGPSALDRAIADRVKNAKPAAEVAPAVQPSSAIPVEQKFIRSTTNRGAFVYTPSPRGQTKAQWEAMDAEKSSANK